MSVKIYTFISTQTASVSSTLDFTSLTNTYNSYRFVISNLLTSVGCNFQIKSSTDNLSTFTTNGQSVSQFACTTVGNEPTKISSSVSTLILCAPDASRTINGFIDISNIGESTKQIQANFDVSMSGATTSLVNNKGFFVDTVRENVNSIRFLPSTGTLTSGTIILYGIS